MNDLNSVLLEGIITGKNHVEDDAANPKFVDIKFYRKASAQAKKGSWTTMRIDVSALHPRYLLDLVEGRKIRVVGRLARIGRAMTGIIAEHVELKPMMNNQPLEAT
jgi:hypothetical protein